MTREELERAYLAAVEPWQQSGFSGPEARWVALRRPVADCVDRSGAFLDVGCANGYLLECLRRWTAARGIALDLFGVDVSAPLVALARARLPERAASLWVADASAWTPPRRFDFVRTELVYVAAEHEANHLRHLLARYLAPGGALLVANYLEGAADPAAHILPGCHPTTNILARLADLGLPADDHRDGFDPVKGRRTRVAILRP